MHVIQKNKRAFYDYLIDERYEAGLVLNGLEVRTVKTKGINISESFVRIDKDEAWLWNAYIEKDNKSRKLLLHKKEIREIQKKVKEKGWSTIPLTVGISGNGYIKVEIGVGKGKRKYDKREAEKQKSIEKELRKVI